MRINGRWWTANGADSQSAVCRLPFVACRRGEKSRDSGMTFIEIILAMVILGICMLGLMTGISSALEVFRSSAYIHEAESAFHAGEALHPLIVKTDPVSDLEVSSDSEAFEGWTYERIVEEDDDEDGLFLVRTVVKKGRGGPGLEQEYLRLIYYKQ